MDPSNSFRHPPPLSAAMVKNTPSSPSGALSPSTLSSLESLPFEQGTVSAPPDGGLDVSRLAEDDPLATQMWKYFARAKTAQTGPHAVRMENLSWRMGGMKLEQIRSQQELRQHTASPSQSPFMSLDGYSIFTSITTTSPHDNIDHNYNNTDDPIPIHPDLHPSYASERPRGRDRQPRAYTSSSASTDTRDETVVGLREGTWTDTPLVSQREPSVGAMDWQDTSHFHSRQHSTSSSTAPHGLSSSPASFVPYSIDDMDPTFFSASFDLDRPSSSSSSVHPYSNSSANAESKQALSDAFGQLVSNHATTSSASASASSSISIPPHSATNSESSAPWPNSCPPTSMFPDYDDINSLFPNEGLDDEIEFARKLQLFTYDEAARPTKTMGSIPGLLNEKTLKENQHSEYGYIPRLVRKTSFDESGRIGRATELRRPSPARAVVEPGKKRPIEDTIRTLSPLRHETTPASTATRAFAGRVEAANRRYRKHLDLSSASASAVTIAVLDSATLSQPSSSASNSAPLLAQPGLTLRRDLSFPLSRSTSSASVDSDKNSLSSLVQMQQSSTQHSPPTDLFHTATPLPDLNSRPESRSSRSSTNTDIDTLDPLALSEVLQDPSSALNQAFGVINPTQVLHQQNRASTNAGADVSIPATTPPITTLSQQSSSSSLTDNIQQPYVTGPSSMDPITIPHSQNMFHFSYTSSLDAALIHADVTDKQNQHVSPFGASPSNTNVGTPAAHQLYASQLTSSPWGYVPSPAPSMQNHHSGTPSPVTDTQFNHMMNSPYHKTGASREKSSSQILRAQASVHASQAPRQYPYPYIHQQVPFHHSLVSPVNSSIGAGMHVNGARFPDLGGSLPSSVGSSPASVGDNAANLNKSANTAQLANSPGKKSDTSICYNCQTSNTPLWRRDETGKPLCNSCGLYLKLHGIPRPLSLATGVIKKRNRRGKTGDQKA